MLSKNVQLHHMADSFETLKVALPGYLGRLTQGKSDFDAIARIQAARFAVVR